MYGNARAQIFVGGEHGVCNLDTCKKKACVHHPLHVFMYVCVCFLVNKDTPTRAQRTHVCAHQTHMHTHHTQRSTRTTHTHTTHTHDFFIQRQNTNRDAVLLPWHPTAVHLPSVSVYPSPSSTPCPAATVSAFSSSTSSPSPLLVGDQLLVLDR